MGPTTPSRPCRPHAARTPSAALRPPSWGQVAGKPPRPTSVPRLVCALLGSAPRASLLLVTGGGKGALVAGK
ncbi:hypothetical protein NDU88_003698 [Pleurodeles waltl]|uniref:Uncharacterized protein n=1 Tax=Pleurodeles waltl TaxID=8319 RepID=A0AAV7W345_PLEWA|nr:hypothetical protein NDU88_003698 [Pleurodeles waltl]